MQVKDPEIDSVSIVDLGMVEEVTMDGNNVKVVLLPTFIGCPALEIIKKNTLNAVQGIAEAGEVEVEFVFHPPWTSDRITKRACEFTEVWYFTTPKAFRRRRVVACRLCLLRFDLCDDGKYIWSNSLQKYSLLQVL